MKKQFFLASGTTLLLAVVLSVSVCIKNGKQSINAMLNPNVEALASSECLDNTHMHLWWVVEHGGGAITCTFGGDLPCK